MPNLLSKPSKMNNATSFSISAAGCITGAKLVKIPGTVCFDCYALKGAYIWGNVKKAMDYREDALNGPNFVSDIVAEINKSKKEYHTKPTSSIILVIKNTC